MARADRAPRRLVLGDPPSTADEVQAWLVALYGAPPDGSGVIHVCSCVERAGRRHVLRVSDEAPKSAVDLFVLYAVRARADAIVTSGRVLRAEPHMTHELGREPREVAALRAYRAGLGKPAPPLSVLLTRSPALPWAHPFFLTGGEVLIWTTPEAARQLTDVPPGVRVVGRAQADGHAVLDYLRAQGASTISVEAGPSFANTLYGPDGAVDELCLSTFSEQLPPALLGGALVDEARLLAGLQRTCRPREVLEPSGLWRFERFRRPSPHSP